jgi:hypothetical protein
MYGMTAPTVAARLAKLYVDERVRDAEARRVARAVRRETRAKHTTPFRRCWRTRTRAFRSPDPAGSAR